ncbi:MAG: CoA transferase [Alphaproteobacteria bacterium]|nr:CoA transferase [Alphaproteobacteria bacterium]
MQAQPLEGTRILDLTQIYQGPYASFLMAMAGADVVKVEPPGGERMRQGSGPQTSLSFATLNSNKRSVAVDLKHPKGKDLLKSMAKQADVLLENFAAGTMDRLGLGWDVMREINPRLIYGSATGYGLTGPDRDFLAMDHTIQAASGMMSITGEEGGPPARAGGTPSDIMGGVHLYAGILQALIGREKTGQGTLVEIAMVETMYFTLTSDLAAYHRTGTIPPRRGDKTPANTAPYGRYRCQDGWIALICVSEAQWDRILEVVGREELIGNPDYGSRDKRHKREKEINAMIEGWCGDLARDEAVEIMRTNRVPVAPIKDLDDVRSDPHMHGRGMLNRFDHPDMGEIVLPRAPIRLSAYDAPAVRFYPDAGANNAEVLSEWLGMSDADIAALEEEKVI